MQYFPRTYALLALATLACAPREDASDSTGSQNTASTGSGDPQEESSTSRAESDSSSNGEDTGEPSTSTSGQIDESPYQEILDGVDAPGAQLVVVEADGDVWVGATGDATEGEPMTIGHHLLIGSNTKTWTAAIVLMLVDEGALTLDDSASTWVPALDPGISVRNLLQHTSGLGDYNEHPDMEGHVGDMWTPDELITLGQDVRNDGPGASVYSNTNFIALGLIIESIEGPYPEVLQSRVLGPLGLEDSGLVEDLDILPDDMAFGDGGAFGVVTPEHPSVGWSAGAGYSTAQDLSTFYRAMLAGELYDGSLLREQLAAVPSDLGFGQPGVSEGYGLGLMVLGVGDQVLTGHLGSLTGFHSWGLRDDESGALAVILTNNSDITSVPVVLEALSVAASG